MADGSAGSAPGAAAPPSRMRLSPRHVAAVTRAFPEAEIVPWPGTRLAADADFDAIVDEFAAGVPADDFWVFAYGSLIWKPAFEAVEERVARVRGWRRSFCLGWDNRFRGNPDAPGLMLALDRGGECTGVAYRLPPDRIRENLATLLRREMRFLPSAFPPRRVRAATPGGGALTALTFAMDRASSRYVGGLDLETLAGVLSRACGYGGSMAEYLYATVSHLEGKGIRDRYLWRLQEMVAERIERERGL